MDASVELYRDNLWSFVNQTVPSESAALGVQQSMQFVFTYQLYRYITIILNPRDLCCSNTRVFVVSNVRCICISFVMG